jgi:hypothetical protein
MSIKITVIVQKEENWYVAKCLFSNVLKTAYKAAFKLYETTSKGIPAFLALKIMSFVPLLLSTSSWKARTKSGFPISSIC